MVRKDFVYLVQGQRERIVGFLHLADRARADALFLTYDEPLDGAIYFPDSTWAEGRNRLLEAAREQGPYRYYVFSDDDTAFDQGGWQELEDSLLSLQPAIAVPVVRRTRETPVRGLPHQVFMVNDEQVMAFHHDVVADGLVLPYLIRFDAVHWWATCTAQQTLIQAFYFGSALQLNHVVVRNECSLRYEDPDEGRETYPDIVRAWLQSQLRALPVDRTRRVGRNKPLAVWKTLLFHLGALRSPVRSHRLAPATVTARLRPDSLLMAQYRAARSATGTGEAASDAVHS